jgi:hypothetical protein
VIVGCRGLHGLASLGSVSERVAHRAVSPVLVVRRGRAMDRSCARESRTALIRPRGRPQASDFVALRVSRMKGHGGGF